MRVLFRLAAVFLLPVSAITQTHPSAAIHSPGRVALSPDGTTLAYTMHGKEGTELHLVPLPATGTIDMAKDKVLAPHSNHACSSTDPIWSRDAKTLAFTSSCTEDKEKPAQEQIFLYTPADGNIRQLTHLVGNLQQAAWSPDGKQIAFLFVENATRIAGALDAMKPFAGVIGEDNVELQRLEVVSATDGKENWHSGGINPYVYEFAWSPDSKQVAYVAADLPGENNWWIAKLMTAYVLPRGVAARMCCSIVVDPQKVSGPLHGLQIAVPKWSPDGKKIAFIGGLMSDQGSTGGDVYVVDVVDAQHEAQPVDVTPNLDGTVTHESFVAPNHVGFVEDHRGHTLILDWDIDKKAAVPNSAQDLGEVTLGGGAVKDAPSFSPANGGFTVWTQSSFNQWPEIWGGGVEAPRPLTRFNAEAPKPDTKVESVEWENDGFHVQGWLAYPKDYDPKKHYGIIVTVHGGPSASAGPRYGSRWASLGYFEFMPNPRGSFGQGEAFTQANVKDFGYGDLRDIEKGLDTVEARIPAIDHNREGITGWSYGGFMTMFAVTQTTRFKAAVAGAGISNWQSYYGENSIDQWMIPFFGASVYDDPAVYAKSSAISFIKKVKTPTLVIVGDRDGECPAPQSFEFWHALRDLGVKTQLVVYPNEGHGFRDPEHIRDRAEREARWFAENMPEK